MPAEKSLNPWPWRNLKDEIIIGVDEVGRGCLAGPVYAAAVRLNSQKDCSPFVDSKQLSARRREIVSQLIREEHEFGIGIATVEEIDAINILQASFLAMKRALAELGHKQGHVLVDGHQVIPGLAVFRQTAIVKGDSRAEPIGAASIVAKVARDAFMEELAGTFPQYGFAGHKGYSTLEHKEAIKKFGPCPWHRKTFAGVREHLPTSLETWSTL